MVTGTYTGDGQVSRKIDLGFTPGAVLLFARRGVFDENRNASITVSGLILPDAPLYSNDSTGDGYIAAQIVEGGFEVYYVSTGTKHLSTNATYNGINPFRYIAFR